MAQSITPVTIRGRYLWKGNERFLVNGVVYQYQGASPTPLDPLTDDRLEELEQSIPLLKELKINTLYVLHFDEAKGHDACMNLLADSGIYVLPCIAWSRMSGPRTPFKSYTPWLLQRFIRSIDELAPYPNVLGVIVSSDGIGDITASRVAPNIRALVRDVKRYTTLLATKKGCRALPVGLTAPDSEPLLKTQFDYFCSGNSEEAIDFFAFSNFDWVGDSSMRKSGYSKLVELFSEAPIPVFFSEYGSNVIAPRIFEETKVLFTHPDMLRVFSGGIIFEFFDEPSGYGLVRQVPNSYLQGSASSMFSTSSSFILIPKLSDYPNLRQVIRQSFARLPASALARSAALDALAMSGAKPESPRPSWNWLAGNRLPKAPIDWVEVETHMIDDSEWVDVHKEMLDLAVEDLANSVWERMNIDGIEP